MNRSEFALSFDLGFFFLHANIVQCKHLKCAFVMFTYAAYVYALKQILRHLKQYDDDLHRNLDQYKTKATT